ncbi:hypothetical protein BDA99DRAFT_560844 [Phascolomyces articulosus]|uniref:Galactose oxidase n=1 Tax=Phascolomyces articulosus TaxID=60185 RepID=A0AAD5K7P1_9FUNG|nr:hypothetical protein BDA99DRAFT_560844 [Phascolomyces articulosus]
MKIYSCLLSAAALVGLEVMAMTPEPRYGGDSILLNRRLYYYGGRGSTGTNTTTLQDLIYLDITNSAQVSSAQSNWQQAQVTGGLTAEPNYLYAMAVIPDLNSIMIYGGAGYNSENQLLQHSVVVYNATTDTWQNLAEPQPRLKQVFAGTASRGDDGKAYVFGGRSYASGIMPPFNRDVRIYDFAAASWSQGAALPANVGVRFRTPTTLAGKDLYYIGGMTANYTDTQITSDNIMVPMTDILIYNIDDNQWRTAQATGDIPNPRIMHTIASKPNSQDILLYGGKYNISTNVPIPGNICYVLNTNSMAWEKKNPVGVGPGALYGHAAVFADYSSLLFIMFGVNSTGNSQSGFHILNTETWTWDASYLSSYPGQDDGSSGGGSSNSISGGAIAGIVVGCVAGVSIIAGLLFFLIRRRRRNGNKEEMTTGGKFTNVSDGTGGGGVKPEDTNDGIPNATLSPLLPSETAPPYRAQVPDEIDPPMALSVQNTNNAQSAPRTENMRAVKPDGE